MCILNGVRILAVIDLSKILQKAYQAKALCKRSRIDACFSVVASSSEESKGHEVHVPVCPMECTGMVKVVTHKA